ncbi:hypothetical protein [Streptomyces sp. NPDC050485]|uniref:hypothetical protein n=1 Tax=Streptomyces sp. NPDC050485 TaxID=3365617 RepID=UPI00379E7381
MGLGALLPIWLIALIMAGCAIAASFLVERGKRTGCLLASATLAVVLLLPAAALLIS